MPTLGNKVALVTGASKGIGASIAKHLASAGATIIVNYASSKTDAERVVTAITDAGGTGTAIQGDFSEPEEIAATFAEIKRRFGKLDILVNNAGIYNHLPIDQITAEDFHRHYNLNHQGGNSSRSRPAIPSQIARRNGARWHRDRGDSSGSRWLTAAMMRSGLKRCC